MSKTNRIIAEVMESLESGKYNGEPEYNLKKMLNQS